MPPLSSDNIVLKVLQDSRAGDSAGFLVFGYQKKAASEARSGKQLQW
ncbi:hypothetical protein GKG82_08120 [Salmonella enterica]|uniref:Uncharacterized protein n=1 Tax=Salmonella enterica TaxID=28901 RepID=A0A743EPV6_SALER|nr:hypothetical protein [Salmonella enterica subsp. enterica serovar Hvittingfoss]EDR2706084.1 hypothetical protein [Salmonella enterica subsp. enterica serovar Enteritidis]EEA1387101.1 hypothetical protein [Salmonella enterica]EHN5888124.1 hypothetical protein [Salmonella enterica subsp. enterica serovar Newport]EKR1800084.1 hypothetical protein [Salmonella enterica subsp. enterica serovar Dublin]